MENTTDRSPVVRIDGDPFFGRAEQQKRFRTLLRELRDLPDPREAESLPPYVMLICGDGGIGKTTLLRRFRQIMNNEEEFANQFELFWLDWDNHRDHIAAPDAETVYDEFYKAATAHRPWGEEPFATYQELKRKRDEIEQKVARLSLDQSNDTMGKLRQLTPRDLALFLRHKADMFRLCSLLGVASDDKTSWQQLRSSTENYLLANFSKSEFDLFKDPQRELARALGEGLRNLADTRPLVILMDTYEHVDRSDLSFRVVLKEGGPRIAWIIAGRNDLRRSRQDDTSYVRGYEQDFPSDRLITYDMGELAQEDVQRYFEVQVPDAPLDDDSLDAITQATRGIPLAVRQAAQIYEQERSVEAVVDIPRGIPHYEIIEQMTERYLRHCLQNNEVDKQALYMLAFAGGSERILRALRMEERTGQDFSTYMRYLERTYASVYRHTGQGTQQSYQLHEAPAMFFREHLRAQRSEEWVQNHIGRAVTAVRTSLADLEQQMPLIEERCEDDDENGWISNAIELARYLLWRDKEEALHWIIPRFVEGLAYSEQLRDGLMKVLRAEHTVLNKRDKTWLKALESSGGTYYVPERESQLHEELRHSRHQSYLAGEGEAERWAIISIRQGDLCVDRDQYQQAQQLYAEAERGLPDEGEKLRGQLAMQWKQLARKLDDQRRWVEALDAINSSLRLNPDDAIALNNRGWHHSKLGKHQCALDDLNRSLELDPKDPITLSNRGAAYRALGMYEQAIHDYTQALTFEANAPDPGIYAARGHCYAYMGQYAKAQEDFDRAQQICIFFPEDEPLFGMAVSAALRHESVVALDYLRQGMKGHQLIWQVARQGYYYDNAFAPLCRHDPQFAAAFEALLQEFTPPWANPQKGNAK